MWHKLRNNASCNAHFTNTVQGGIYLVDTSSMGARTLFVLVNINRPQHYICVMGPQLEVTYLTILCFVTIISYNMNEQSLISGTSYNGLNLCFQYIYSHNVFSNQQINNSNICWHPSLQPIVFTDYTGNAHRMESSGHFTRPLHMKCVNPL